MSKYIRNIEGVLTEIWDIFCNKVMPEYNVKYDMTVSEGENAFAQFVVGRIIGFYVVLYNGKDEVVAKSDIFHIKKIPSEEHTWGNVERVVFPSVGLNSGRILYFKVMPAGNSENNPLFSASLTEPKWYHWGDTLTFEPLALKIYMEID